MRAVVYARYSTDLQSEASIEDQVEVCRRLIDARGWQLVGTYDDRALSGASRFRPGLERLLADAEAKRFDVVVLEALDRLGRKLADVASIFDRLNFLRIALHTVSQGEITTMHIGLLGTMAQLQLTDLRDKTRRGLIGRVRKGRSAGGIAYGYRADPTATGVRTIEPAEAAIVRRIFTEFAAGRSPRAIAKRLNAEAVPGPGDRAWRDTTIRGQLDRGTGLLNNELYIGRLVWNRTAYVKDPRTGRRVARVNAAAAREVQEVPDLQIVDDTLWIAVKRRQLEVRTEMTRDAAGNALNRAHRRRYLLSGLLVCGCCGGAYSVVSARYGCATRKAKGTCTNATTITPAAIEARVLAGLKDRLLAPELVETFAKAYIEEINRARRDIEGNLESRRRELATIERKIAGIMAAIEDGLYQPAFKPRLAELNAAKAAAEMEIARTTAPAPVRLHPNLAQLYRQKVAELERALNDLAVRDEAAEILRSLIEKVLLTPDPDAANGLRAELHGDLAAILAIAGTSDRPDRKNQQRWDSVAAHDLAKLKNTADALFTPPTPTTLLV